MILDKIVAHKKIQLEIEKRETPQCQLEAALGDLGDIRDFKGALAREGLSIIAEIKKASPSKGVLREDFDEVIIGSCYEQLGVDAVSILTEREFFKGSDIYIKEVKQVNRKPILRKDFILDEYQLFQARAIQADAVLLIAGVLGSRLREFYLLASRLGLSSLVEVHDEQELERALQADCEIIGINNRNLKDFSVDIRTTESLMRRIPKGKIIVSESGISSEEDIRFLKDLGVDGILVGETFMKNLDDYGKMEQFVREVRR